MATHSLDSFSTRSTLTLGSHTLEYFSLPRLAAELGTDLGGLPVSLRILLENLLRNEDGQTVCRTEIEALARWDPGVAPKDEIAFRPARVILQDFTGVPAVVDLAAMRDAMAAMGGDPARIEPLFPAELVIDHSVQVDAYGTTDALLRNVTLEYERNRERYSLLRWAQGAFEKFQVVPPSTGIVHQVNVEHLARVVFAEDGLAYPDTLVGTDSHTTMVNGIGVLGWGVGGIEAEAAMLGQPIAMLVPEVVGVELRGALPVGTTATDLVLTIVKLLRDRGVVGRFVEFFGAGLAQVPVADRATIANMGPEFGSTCALFPIDEETLAYLRLTGRREEDVALVEAYARAQGLFRTDGGPEPRYSERLVLDLSTVVPTIAGPRRPHDKVALADAKAGFAVALPQMFKAIEVTPEVLARRARVVLEGTEHDLAHGSVVIAAITSCTNTSNPSVMMGAGLLARNAVRRGLRSKPWVKTSLAPGSQVVTEYLRAAGLLGDLEVLGFHVVGYGCTTCIGNSGPLPDAVTAAIREQGLLAVSVLSGNRNFEGRISPDVRANYLASPPLVVAYALAGRIDLDLTTEPLGQDRDGRDVFLRDLWPSPEELREAVARHVTADLFQRKYADVFRGDDAWHSLPVPAGSRFTWDPDSTYVRHPTFFASMPRDPAPLVDLDGARVLGLLGDMVTTDHISPAGSIAKDSPAARYLTEHGVAPRDFNSYGARRGNHEVMMRGTFANVRLKNLLCPGTEGGVTLHLPDGAAMSIFDAAMQYRAEGVPLVVVAGKDYGTGSSRDWAAKGTFMLGVRAVLAQSFERIHRSNLIGMGVLPLEFLQGEGHQSLGLTGEERLQVTGIATDLVPGKVLDVTATAPGRTVRFRVKTRIDTLVELDYYRHGGILQLVLRQLLAR
ncbi:MAG: aconitate hydratase AcnA [Polyangiaceae bacterium]|nr:aconitate hydratase AcnA [Polyangiaceae bacterium]